MFSPLTNPNTQVGLVPLGGIIAIASQLSGSFPLPASGTVYNGWMRADGSAIPTGNALSGTTPNLTGGNFVYGTSGAGAGANPVAGATGGAGTYTLLTANLPSGTIGTMTPAGTLSIAGTNTGNSLSGGVAGAQSWTFGGSGSTVANTTGGGSKSLPNGGSGNTGNNPGAQLNAQWTNGTLNATAYAGDYNTHTHSIPALAIASVSGTNTSSSVTGTCPAQTWTAGTCTFTGSSGNVASSGSGTAFAIVPPYVAAVYMLRVS